jgi:chemotaxis protein CheZ
MEQQQPMSVSPEVFQQLGSITRMLHDTMQQLGVMPRLQVAAAGIPDARSRLTYVAEKTQRAAETVLDCVEKAKLLESSRQEKRQRLENAIANGTFNVNDLSLLLAEFKDSQSSMEGYLTHIMMAQDFHDLTGQVVAKVVGLANELESSLVELLKQVAPNTVVERHEALNGPVVDVNRKDVVNNQSEVDDLLASMGF